MFEPHKTYKKHKKAYSLKCFICLMWFKKSSIELLLYKSDYSFLSLKEKNNRTSSPLKLIVVFKLGSKNKIRINLLHQRRQRSNLMRISRYLTATAAL